MRLAIETKNLSKTYPLKNQKNQVSLKEALSSFFIRSKKMVSNDKTFFYALENLNLKIEKGEIVGIIGKNGSGKSTLLKLLSKITYPSDGSIKIFGKVASLLEVGAGFHPELTGEENIYLAGAILGMKKKQIKAKLYEIVSFSELEDFIHLPVKKYSSGMFLRLGFSVIAHLDADILLVDEILSVADKAFQKKCISKLKMLSYTKTILYVSHHLETVEQLCTRCLVLDKGVLIFDGHPKDAIRKFIHPSCKISV